MDREILFRGKRTDNGEWVEGYLFGDGIKGSGRAFVGGLVITDSKGASDDKYEMGIDFYEVDQSTVGQYTGLKDKAGERIFDGDIVLAYENEKYVVCFSQDRGGWFPFARGDGCGCCEHEVVDGSDGSVIIGNIYDNKDLLN